jgi:hypothetical protein
MASKKNENAPLPAEHPEAPPSPALLEIQAPSAGRVVQVKITGELRRPAFVTHADGAVISATAFTDPSKDCAIYGVPCPVFLALAGLVHDARDEAPMGTWRYPPHVAGKLSVER